MKILIDNGHGVNTPGKCSPDGVFQEYKYTREIAAAVVKHLGYWGFDAALVTPEEYDISLRAHTERVNTWCRQLGKRNVCLVSIHTNAAGNGKQWMSARGWICYTSRGQSAGDHLADCLYRAAALWLPGHKAPEGLFRRRSRLGKRLLHPQEHPLCRSLTENLFHDNSDDCLSLESGEGRRAIVALHVEGIVNYVLKR